MLALDEDINAKYRNPIELGKYIRETCANKEHYFYVLLDEIQKVDSIQNIYLPDNPNEERFNCVISRHCQTMSERQAVLQQLAGEKSELTKYAEAMLAEQKSEPVPAPAPDTSAQ